MSCVCFYPSLHLSRIRRRRSSHSTKQCYINSLQRCARLPPAFYANLSTGNWSFTLSTTMFNCWTISTEGTSSAQGSDSSGGADPRPFPVELSRSIASAELPSVPIPMHGTPGDTVEACSRPLKGHTKITLVCICKMSRDFQRIRNVVQNGLAILGSANRENPSTWFYLKKRGSPLLERQI